MAEPWNAILTCLLIVLMRVGDVSIGTVRTIQVINGRRTTALVLGFFEILIWIYAVSTVVGGGIERWYYAVSYALGFATGNWVGITVERAVAQGQQVIRIFTHTPGLAWALRQQGHRVTQFTGEGRDGPVLLLYIKTERRSVRKITDAARTLDNRCFWVVEDVRQSSTPSAAQLPGAYRPTGWRSTLFKK